MLQKVPTENEISQSTSEENDAAFEAKFQADETTEAVVTAFQHAVRSLDKRDDVRTIRHLTIEAGLESLIPACITRASTISGESKDVECRHCGDDFEVSVEFRLHSVKYLRREDRAVFDVTYSVDADSW